MGGKEVKSYSETLAENKLERLQEENRKLRELIHRMAKEMFEHGGSYAFDSLREYNEQMVRET